MRLAGVSLVLFGSLLAGPVLAQGIQIPPDERDFLGRSTVILGSGARAFGMGGAFLARADDATAASWNPAGLSYLRRPELSVVGTRTEQLITSPVGSDEYRDEFLGYAPDFASAALPVQVGSTRGAVQLSYQRLFSFQGERTITRPDGTTLVTRGAGGFDVVAVGSGLQVNRQLRVGLTLNRWLNGYEQHRQRNTFRRMLQQVDFKLSGWNVNAGAIWTPLEGLNLGAVAKTPFTADVTLTRSRQDSQDPATATVTYNSGSSDAVRLDFPGAVGVGASWRLRSTLTVSLDYTRTFWSKGRIYNFFTLPATPIGQDPPPPTVYPTLLYPTFDDTAQVDTGQLRGGGEYVLLLGRVRVPLRVGYFRDRQYFRVADGAVPTFNGFTVGTGLLTGPFLLDIAYLRESGKYIEPDAFTEVTTRFERFFVSLIYRYGRAR